MERKQVALTGHRLEQYDELRDWLSDHQKPGDPRLTPQVVIELAFAELLKRKHAGNAVDISFTDDRLQHAWRNKNTDGILLAGEEWLEDLEMHLRNRTAQ